MLLLRWEGGFARGAVDLWVGVRALLQMWRSTRGWEAMLAGCKERSWETAKAVQAWRVQLELVHLTEDGNKKARNGYRRDQG